MRMTFLVLNARLMSFNHDSPIFGLQIDNTAEKIYF